MPLQNGINSVIHEAKFADLTAYTYTNVYAGVTTPIMLNDTVVLMVAGTIIPILVRNISSTDGIFVIGDKKSTSDPGGTTGKIL